MRNVKLQLFTFRLELVDSSPLIWREFRILSNTTLGTLHHVIQDAMGWTNSHLHSFYVGEKEYGAPFDPEDILCDDEDPNTLDENAVTVSTIFMKIGDEIEYVYDFGDDWTHKIKLLDLQLPTSPSSSPSCLAGSEACPPEDCGGIHMYNEMRQAITSPEHPMYQHAKYFFGRKRKPSRFNLKETDSILFKNHCMRLVDNKRQTPKPNSNNIIPFKKRL